MGDIDETVSFGDYLIALDVVGFFDQRKKLASGRESNYYANCRRLTDTVDVAMETAYRVRDFIVENCIDFDYVIGVPDGATKLGILVNVADCFVEGDNVSLVQMRSKPKAHGDAKDRYFIGPVDAGDKVVLVEDVTTTGGSLLKKIVECQDADLDVVGAVGLVNRLETTFNVGELSNGLVVPDGLSVEDAVSRLGVKYMWMSDSHSLLPIAAAKYNPSDSVKSAIEKDFDQYGVKPFRF